MSFFEKIEYELAQRLEKVDRSAFNAFETSFVSDVVEQYDRAWLLDDLSWREDGTVGRVWTTKQCETIKEILEKHE